MFNIINKCNKPHKWIKDKKNHMIISVDAENIFDKIQRIFMIKILERVGLEGTYINIIQSVYIRNPQSTSS